MSDADAKSASGVYSTPAPSAGGSKKESSKVEIKPEPSAGGSKKESSKVKIKPEPSAGGSKHESIKVESKPEPSAGGSKQESTKESGHKVSAQSSKKEVSRKASEREPTRKASKQEPTRKDSKQEPTRKASKQEPTRKDSKQGSSQKDSKNESDRKESRQDPSRKDSKQESAKKESKNEPNQDPPCDVGRVSIKITIFFTIIVFLIIILKSSQNDGKISFKNAATHRHNFYRAIYGSQLLDTSDVLVVDAQKVLKELLKEVKNNDQVQTPKFENGTCTFMMSMPNAHKLIFSGFDIVEKFYSGKKHYDYDSDSCVYKTNETKDYTCDCFTQLMWNSTYTVGCAYEPYDEHTYYAACKYQPAGNVAGAYKENVPYYDPEDYLYQG